MENDTATQIRTAADLPSDGCITIRPWDRARRQGWHVERIENVYDAGAAWVTASPMNLTSGAITGEPRRLHLRFDLDTIEAMA